MKAKLLTEVIRLNIASAMHSVGRNNVKASRYYYQMDGLNDYIEIPSKIINDDIYLACDYLISELPPSNQSIIGGSGGSGPGQFTLYIDPDYSSISAQIPTSNGSVYASVQAVVGKMSRVSLSIKDGKATISCNGESRTVDVVNPSVEVRYIGKWSSGLYFKRIIANVDINREHYYPIESPDIIDTTGGVNGIPHNFQDESWVKVA